MTIMFIKRGAEPHSSVGRVADLRTEGRWFDPRLGQYSFRGLISHCKRIHSSLTAVHCFDDGYLGKQPPGLERMLCRVLLKELQESVG